MQARNADERSRTAEELAHAYLVALQAKDKQAILSLVADGFTLEVPINVSGSNDLSDSWRGIEAASAAYDTTFKLIEILKYVDVEITPGKDPNIAFAEGRGDMKMSNGRPYRNRYMFRFDAANGKLTRIREFANPVTAALSWGMPLPQSEPVEA